MGSSLLSGRRILVTRPEERGEGLLERVEAAGGVIVHRPAIAFDPPQDTSVADRVVRELASFDWLVFTSPAGVKFFLQRLRESGAGPVPETVRLAVVGPGTAGAVGEAGYQPDLVPGRSDADGLAEELAGKSLEGRKVLWVRPETARPRFQSTLEAAGAQVTAAVFYRTVPHPECHLIAADLATGRYDGVLFTSPSTFRAVFDALSSNETANFRRVVKVAIGEVTASAMDAAGCPSQATAVAPTPDGVAAAFEAAFDAAALC
jgi:uroporphyrinogen-III synthase